MPLSVVGLPFLCVRMIPELTNRLISTRLGWEPGLVEISRNLGPLVQAFRLDQRTEIA